MAPLSPWQVFQCIAKEVRPYSDNCPVIADQHSADAHRDIATRTGVRLIVRPITAQNRNSLFERLKGLCDQGWLELAPEPTLIRDLNAVRRRLTPSGLTYHLPKTPDGRHADFVPALMMALSGFATHAEQQLADARRRRDEEVLLSVPQSWLSPEQTRARAMLEAGPEAVAREQRIYRQANFRSRN